MVIDAGAISPARIGEALIRATLDVLETMFFTSIENCEEGSPQWQTGPLGMRLTFAGPLEGELRLCLDRSAAAALASTLSCLEPEEVGSEQSEQAAGELANMICGCLLSHLEPDANITLGCPGPAGTDPLEGAIERWFQLPEGALAIAFRFDCPDREGLPCAKHES